MNRKDKQKQNDTTNPFLKILVFLFYVLIIGLLMSMTKQNLLTRILFWPVFIFSSLLFTAYGLLGLVQAVTLFQLPDSTGFIHWGATYYSKWGNKYEFSLNILWLVLFVLGMFIVWKAVNILELKSYESNAKVSVLEKVLGAIWGVFVLFYLFNATSSNGHIVFFIDTFEYYGYNPFQHDHL